MQIIPLQHTITRLLVRFSAIPTISFTRIFEYKCRSQIWLAFFHVFEDTSKCLVRYKSIWTNRLHINVYACRDPLRDHPDVHPAPVFGPSICFAGQPARWTGDSHSFKGQIGIEARVTFETFASKRTTSFLEILNDGTTAIYFDWKVGSGFSPSWHNAKDNWFRSWRWSYICREAP